MQRDQTPMPHLGRMVAKFEYATDFTIRAWNHIPSQLCDLASTKTSLSVRIPVRATMDSDTWRPLDPVDDDQGGA
jgi:hypothetical protein